MAPIIKTLASLLCLSLGVASKLVQNDAHNGYGSTSHSLSPATCFSSPLFSLETRLDTAQCRETSSNTTWHQSTQEPSPEDDSSSGGWSGPHACAGSYCVYTNPSFAAKRGISIISDGDTANALANLPVFVDLASPRASALLAQANVNTQSNGVETKHIANKGRGFAASRPIHRGEQVIAYTPALVFHRALFDNLSSADKLHLIRDAVRRLPTQTRMAFWKQLGQTHEDDDNDMLDIVINNSFNLPLSLSGAVFVGNFPEVSMYNHDCRPNVAFHMESGLVHRTHAVGYVGAGEELSISYVDSFRVREVRRARTVRNWGFGCACAQCMLPPTLVNASDSRLSRIYEVENSLVMSEQTSKVKRAPDVADRVELLLSLYQQERLLESHGAVAYKTAAVNYNALGRETLAVKYALLALEAYIVEHGAASAGTTDMVKLLDEPKNHWSWKKRV